MEREEIILLVEKAMKGDKRAMDELCAAKMGSILYRANKLVNNVQDAEDIAQEVALKMYSGIGNLRDANLFNAWLQAIIINESNTMFRKRAKSMNKVLSVADSELFEVEQRAEFLPREYAEDKEKRLELLEIIDGLAPKTKNVLVMYYYEGMNSFEIAGATGTSASTVRNSLAKAKKTIKKELEKRHGKLEAIAMSAAVAPVMESVLKYEAAVQFPKPVVDGVVRNVQTMVATGVKNASVAAVAVGQGFKTAVIATVSFLLVGGLLAASVALFGAAVTPYPSSSFAADPVGDPQPTTGSLAEDDGEAIYNGPVGGTFAFVNHAGQHIEDTSLGFEEYKAVIVDETQTILYQTEIESQGGFEFGDVTLEAGKTYALRVLGGQVPLTVMADNSVLYGLALQPRQGQALAELQVMVTVTQSLTGTVVPAGGVGNVGHVNPQSLTFVANEVKVGETRWEIVPLGGGAALHNGEGAQVTNDVLARLPSGEYTVVFTGTDVFGNSGQVRYDFVID